MSKLLEYKELFDSEVVVLCTDGTTIKGCWSEWFSAEDNEWADEEENGPHGESIIIDTAGGAPVEVYVAEIERIEAA